MERDRLSAIQSSWDKLRNVRNIHISNTDWVMLSDISMTTEKKEEWETYRQALREVPSKTSDPTNVTWPTPPS